MEGLCLVNTPVKDAAKHLKAGHFFWLDLESPSDEQVAELGKLLKLHPLTIDDTLKFGERPKFDEYPGYAYLVAYGADVDIAQAQDGDPNTSFLHEIHLIISGDCVVTVRRDAMPQLDDVRERLSGQVVRSEQLLVYRILDAITQTFFPVLAKIDDEIDAIEDEVIATASAESLKAIFSLKRDLVAMRRVVTPMRDVFARNAERIADLPGMQPDDGLYFRDLYDAMIRVSDLVDSYRDLLSGATDLYLSTVANKQGEINKQLTIIATIFLPLSFLTGFFGQNFSFLTNKVLTGTASFLVLGLGLLVASTVGLVIFFRTRHWI